MASHITKLCASLFYYIYNIRRTRKYLSGQSTEILVYAFISSRLDYCNGLLYGLPDCLLNRQLQLKTSICLQSLSHGWTVQYATQIFLFQDIPLSGKIEGHTREAVEYSSMLKTSTRPASLKNGPQYLKAVFNKYGRKFSVRNLNLFLSVQFTGHRMLPSIS